MNLNHRASCDNATQKTCCANRLMCVITIGLAFAATCAGTGLAQSIPEPLQPWQQWATWDVKHRNCPKIYSRPDQPICFWPSRLALSADGDGATWKVTVDAFEETWVPLPGGDKIWPISVTSDQQNVVVVPRNGHPAVKIDAGRHELEGEFDWGSMPQKIAIPMEVGVIDLQVNGAGVDVPAWDVDGNIWLRRVRTESADKDLLDLRVYRVIDDGIPVWLRTEVELTVSGKSREEELGWVLPEGWQLSTVQSSIPVAVDDRGLMKAQVRAGKWTVSVDAFRTTDLGDFRFSDQARPITESELVALRMDPSFRVSQIDGLSMVDVTQTTFPSKWGELPVYTWDTSTKFQLQQKMRGMGQRSPQGLRIHRQMWLDEDGKSLTFRDKVSGEMQQIWRLDVAEGHELGAVRAGGIGQLITANPQSGASGVEVRDRKLDMEAVGRVNDTSQIAATGWQANADSLELTMTLPPGWRVFAVLGADHVQGDWLTAWTLLDLFLLLIFSLAVFRLYGWVPGLIALLAFGLAYHEPLAPRFTWLFLLMPLALLRVVGEGPLRSWVSAWKYVAITLLLLSLIPFVASQTQSTIYPQLEPADRPYGSRDLIGLPTDVFAPAPGAAVSGSIDVPPARYEQKTSELSVSSNFDVSNLHYDPKSRIQTGPAEPQWNWTNVYCVWNGPVASQQRIEPILISLTRHRILSVIRLILLILLAAMLLGGGRLRFPFGTSKRAASILLAACFITVSLCASGPAQAQIPDADMLDVLRKRVLETPDVFPNAADIPSVELTLRDGTITTKAQVHAAIDVAVPLPGRLPSWSPISITLDGKEDVLVSRKDGYLWVLVPQGVHEIVVEGLLPEQTEWVWTFQLPPRYVTVDAEGWKITGIDSNGVPDTQVFFVEEQAASADQAAYDRTAFNAVVVVDRYVEVGLVAKVHNTVTRLSAPGKAISLEVPLLDGESVLTSGRTVNDGAIAVRMGANQESFSWDSDLALREDVRLVATQTDRFVQRWHLITSPVWNVSLDGLAPVFDVEQKALIPTWHPWPDESVVMAFRRPVAVQGDVMTVQNVRHETKVGSRRRSSHLTLDLESSLANDFVVQINPDAEIISLIVDEKPVPVRRDGPSLIVPASTGKQSIALQWRTSDSLQASSRSSQVTLPVEASNVTTVMVMPANRWILWADGPLRGPAVRFWTILVVAVLAAFALASLPNSPLSRFQWVLLAIGLTQVHLLAAMTVVGWLFLLAWRGKLTTESKGFNSIQVLIVCLTFLSLTVLVFVVGAGLLGDPRMFIIGNGSYRTYLQWFQPRTGPELPTTSVISISVWFYRLLMLFWALWLAQALLRWLSWGWNQFSTGGIWSKTTKPVVATTVDDEFSSSSTEQPIR